MTLEITVHLTLTVHGGDSLRGAVLADRMEEEETLGNKYTQHTDLLLFKFR